MIARTNSPGCGKIAVSFTFSYPLLSESKAGKTKQDVQKLIIHWDSLDDDLQSFLLSADPARKSNIALGIETIIKTAKKRRNDRAGRAWFDLQELQKISGRIRGRQDRIQRR